LIDGKSFLRYNFVWVIFMPKKPAKNGRAGKNHEWVNGQLLQTNKKWSHLKQQQKMWIQQATAKEHAARMDGCP